MSRYEGMNGKGLVMKKDLKLLKQKLINAHNQTMYGIDKKLLKEYGIKKASNRTTTFPIFSKYDDSISLDGYINLYQDTGSFSFFVEYNNHSMDRAGNSKSFGVLMNFIHQLPNKGKKYGAETYYYNEYDEDEYGNRCPGDKCYYGAWKQQPIIF